MLVRIKDPDLEGQTVCQTWVAAYGVVTPDWDPGPRAVIIIIIHSVDVRLQQ